jgi:hypothetical protein
LLCCTLYVYVMLTIQCSHWPWLGWKLCLNKVIGYYYMYTLDKSQWSTKNRVLRNFPGNRWRTFHNWHINKKNSIIPLTTKNGKRLSLLLQIWTRKCVYVSKLTCTSFDTILWCQTRHRNAPEKEWKEFECLLVKSPLTHLIISRLLFRRLQDTDNCYQ